MESCFNSITTVILVILTFSFYGISSLPNVCTFTCLFVISSIKLNMIFWILIHHGCRLFIFVSRLMVDLSPIFPYFPRLILLINGKSTCGSVEQCRTPDRRTMSLNSAATNMFTWVAPQGGMGIFSPKNIFLPPHFPQK